MQRNREELALWLFDLVHGNLTDQQILQGFIRHYVLHEMSLGNVQDEMVHGTFYTVEQIRQAMESLRRVLEQTAERNENE